MRTLRNTLLLLVTASALAGCAWMRPSDDGLCPGGQNCPEFRLR
jgi:hypothetical protein